MFSIDDYATDSNSALIDAAAEPAFKEFMERDDFEWITFVRGDGTEMEGLALSRRSIQRILGKVLQRARQAGTDYKYWICSPDEFDLCAKLDTPACDLMRKLHHFLENKWTQGRFTIAHVLAITTLHPVGAFLAIFSAVGFVNGGFVELCDCNVSRSST